MSKRHSIDFMRAKNAFAETLRNVWNLNTKLGLIKNRSFLSHYTKAYGVSTTFGSTTFFMQNSDSRYLRSSEFNAVNQSQNL